MLAALAPLALSAASHLAAANRTRVVPAQRTLQPGLARPTPCGPLIFPRPRTTKPICRQNQSRRQKRVRNAERGTRARRADIAPAAARHALIGPLPVGRDECGMRRLRAVGMPAAGLPQTALRQNLFNHLGLLHARKLHVEPLVAIG